MNAEIDESFQCFLSEGFEALNECEESLSGLRVGKENKDTVDALFRHYHTLKGGAGMVGLTSLEKMAHSVEDLLGKVRKGDISFNEKLKEMLIEGNVVLDSLMARVENGTQSPDLLPEEEGLIQNIRSFGQGGEPLEGFVGSFLKDVREMISVEEHGTVDPETFRKIVSRIERLDNEYKAMLLPEYNDVEVKTKSDKGRWVIGKRDVSDLINSITPVFQEEKGHGAADAGAEKELLAKLTELERITQKYSNNGLRPMIKEFRDDIKVVVESAIGLDERLIGVFKEEWLKFVSKLEFQPIVEKPETPEKAEEVKAPEQKKITQENSFRVPQSRLDVFLEQVGDLIIMTEHSSNFLSRMERASDQAEIDSLTQEFKSHSENMSGTVFSLESSLRQVRKVQLKNITRKAQRQMRELARKLGKKVSWEIVDDHIEVDKMIVEKLSDPLMHILRNCLDHGLEAPDERKNLGKDETGKITISAREEEKNFILTISDDGRGIDLDKVREKAISSGFLTAEQLDKMSPGEITKLIFTAGLSTAKKTTTVSGRGVGMDVVGKNIEELKGSVEVTTEKLKGTDTIISIPLNDNLVVSKGVLLRTGRTRLIVETDSLTEILSEDKVETFTLYGKQEMVRIRDAVYPVLANHTLFGPEERLTALKGNRLFFVLETPDGKACLCADEVLEAQSFVIKKLSDYFADCRIFKGSAILNDGGVGLVLDVDNIMNSLN